MGQACVYSEIMQHRGGYLYVITAFLYDLYLTQPFSVMKSVQMFNIKKIVTTELNVDHSSTSIKHLKKKGRHTPNDAKNPCVPLHKNKAKTRSTKTTNKH